LPRAAAVRVLADLALLALCAMGLPKWLCGAATAGLATSAAAPAIRISVFIGKLLSRFEPALRLQRMAPGGSSPAPCA
jgi:hypothetical protein